MIQPQIATVPRLRSPALSHYLVREVSANPVGVDKMQLIDFKASLPLSAPSRNRPNIVIFLTTCSRIPSLGLQTQSVQSLNSATFLAAALFIFSEGIGHAFILKWSRLCLIEKTCTFLLKYIGQFISLSRNKVRWQIKERTLCWDPYSTWCQLVRDD